MHRYVRGDEIGRGAHGVLYRASIKPEWKSKMATKRKLPSPSSASARSETKEHDSNKSDDPEFDDDEDEFASDAVHKLQSYTGSWVALKKIRVRDISLGLSMDAIREIKLLQELEHPNVLRVLDMFNYHENIHLVLEFMETDLEHVINAPEIVLSPADIKSYMQMLLRAVAHIHGHWILHRDIKPGNLLLSSTGDMKLADFGLAKIYGSPDRNLSNQACTLWYRAPELLFGARTYGSAADMWSVGCVMAELMLRVPMFQGNTEINQLMHIFAKLGTPTLQDWPHVESLPSFTEFTPVTGFTMRELFPAASEDALDLIGRLLQLNPSRRISATEALEHRYFLVKPDPTPPPLLPKLENKHDKDKDKDINNHNHKDDQQDKGK